MVDFYTLLTYTSVECPFPDAAFEKARAPIAADGSIVLSGTPITTNPTEHGGSHIVFDLIAPFDVQREVTFRANQDMAHPDRLTTVYIDLSAEPSSAH